MISFVGAGPGDPELITLKGRRLLDKADVVIWAGSLVNPALLAGCQPTCEVYDSAAMTLEQIIDVMAHANAQGRNVVRLHTGDPSLFGAIREQMYELESRGIAYEVVPGVSSMAGAAAALQCEYTVPNVSQSVIICRAEGRTPVPKDQSLVELARHGSTMVIFLSAGLTARVRQDLLAAGVSADTPAALVYRATWPDQQVIRTTVDRLDASAREAGIDRTALIIVGRCLQTYTNDEVVRRSKLYDPSFSTGYRERVDKL